MSVIDHFQTLRVVFRLTNPNTMALCYVRGMSDELKSGDMLTMTAMAQRREELHDVVVSGGYIYLSRNGRRKMALVPAHVAEEHFERENPEEDTPSADDVSIGSDR